jgi:REP element-mobilizing transposase RayT
MLATVPSFGNLPSMNPSPERRPSLRPDFPLSSREISRVATGVESPKPHLGWYSRGYLPHWDHPGMIQSLNFRLVDSLPTSVVERWRMELTHEPEDEAAAIRRRVDKYLDAGHGECWLCQPDIARLAEATLLHFDGQRYLLLAWCIMPNHVHVMIETREGFTLANILHSWKSFTANQANRLLERRGEFWQREYLDRYIRNAEHYEQAIAYIEENPVKAGLARVKADWPWSSARFRQPGSADTGSAGILPAR